MDRDLYLKFSKPFDKRVFSGVAGLGNMNTAHVHGEDLCFDDVLDLTVNIFSWWDRGPKGPSLQYVKERFDGVSWVVLIRPSSTSVQGSS